MINRDRVISLLLFISLFSAAISLQAQRKGVDNLLYFDNRPIHFGFYLGLNTMEYRLSYYDNVYQNPVFQNPALLQTAKEGKYYQTDQFRAAVDPPSPGFTVGGVANIRLGRDLDFRFTPGMSLGSRHLLFSIPISGEVMNQSNTSDEESFKTIPSYYIDLPLGIRYKGFRHHNVRPYVYLGGAYRRDLASKKINESIIHVSQNSAFAEIALGLDSYLEYFRFSGELKFSYGLNNVIRHDGDLQKPPLPYYGYIFKQVYPEIVTLLFFFE